MYSCLAMIGGFYYLFVSLYIMFSIYIHNWLVYWVCVCVPNNIDGWMLLFIC